MTLVVDASLVVSALIDTDPQGLWAEALLNSDELAAPHMMLAEAGNVLRIAALTGRVSQDSASLAHADLLSLRVELFPYGLLARRVWELRMSLTAYDAWYVALAESLDAPLATLDQRLARASGPQCEFRTFAGSG